MKLILKDPQPHTAVTIHAPVSLIVMNHLDITLSTANTRI
jgi:hypothetical protein